MNSFNFARFLLALVLISLMTTACASTQHVSPDDPDSEGHQKILAMAGAKTEGFQPDGSLVECERDNGRGLFTRTIDRLRLKTKLHLKNGVCHEEKLAIREPDDDHYFLPLDRDGSPFMKLEETLWICFRIHKEKVVCE